MSLRPEGDSNRAGGAVDAADADYVGVWTVYGPFDEEQVRSFLQAHGIPTKIRGEAIRRTHGITVDGIGAAEVEVPKRFADAARGLLAKAERGEFRLADDVEEASDEGEDTG